MKTQSHGFLQDQLNENNKNFATFTDLNSARKCNTHRLAQYIQKLYKK